MSNTIDLKWLSPHRQQAAVTWGIPWPKGKLKSNDPLMLQTSDGDSIPVSTWDTAYWDDGSVKWTAHAAVLNGGQSCYQVQKGTPCGYTSPLKIEDTSKEIRIATDMLQCSIPKQGSNFLEGLLQKGKKNGMNAQVVLQVQTDEAPAPNTKFTRTETCVSLITGARVEQESDGRCVIKVDGETKTAAGDTLLLFTSRLYFYTGSPDVKIVFTVTWNTKNDAYRLSGLKLEFSVPVTGELYNRHVAFAGDEGLFLEAARLLHSFHNEGIDFQKVQQNLKLQTLVPKTEKEQWFIENLHVAPIWNHFILNQVTDNSYTIAKSTHDDCCPVQAITGKRSKGMLYMAGEDGGFAFSVRDFWQKCPMALEVTDLACEEPKAHIWLWSAQAVPFSFKPFDTQGHTLEFSYEGGPTLENNPEGISNTNEITLRLFDTVSDKESLLAFAEDYQQSLLPVCSPEYYHSCEVFGVWSLPDDKDSKARYFENVATSLQNFYINEIERRKWYGFWNYGDIMHSYDSVRHVWRYDFGGCAWQNTECAPNLWLWTQFMRTGNAQIYEVARAMTRHTSEVDCYHIGPYSGLGSRHNVVHWGCCCKEARIMMTFLHRYFYYLTADERIGEIMDLVKDADYSAMKKNPMAMYYGTHDDYINVRSGPDWTAFASNWMTYYERHRDPLYLEKIKKGMESIGKDKIGLLAGPTFKYHPDDGYLHHYDDNNYHYQMIVAFGGGEVFFELAQWMPEDTRFQEAIAILGKAFPMSEEELRDFTDGRIKDKHELGFHIALTKVVAYAAHYYKDEKLGQYAWGMLRKEAEAFAGPDGFLNLTDVPTADYPVGVQECIPNTTERSFNHTNSASQLALSYFETYELIREYLK